MSGRGDAMPIRELGIESFKAFAKRTDIPFAPITVLAGANSSGKSSLIHALMLLKQAREGGSGSALRMHGRFVQYKHLSQLTFAGTTGHAYPGIRVTVVEPMSDAIRREFFAGTSARGKDRPYDLWGRLSLAFEAHEGSDGEEQVRVRRLEVKAAAVRGRAQPRWGPTMVFSRKGDTSEVSFSKLPRKYDKVLQDVNAIDWDAFLPYRLLRPGRSEDDRYSPENRERLPAVFSEIVRVLDRDISTRLFYLGPLRARPERVYERSGSPTPDVGLAGERTGEFLLSRGTEEVQVRWSHTEPETTLMLHEAVHKALARMDVIQLPKVTPGERGVTYEVLFNCPQSDGDLSIPITDVGFGFSQVLPVVVLGLSAPVGSLIVFEQPEIHLHPRLQARLADFFITLGLSGRRLLIETHSDHLLNRLRRRIAEDHSNELQKLVNVYFVRLPRKNGQASTIKKYEANEFGNFPEEFFPEPSIEAQETVAAQFDKHERRMKDRNG